MNAFDLVVTVALGSTLATVLLSSSVALPRGVLAFTLLIFLQFGITWLSARSSAVQDFVKAESTLFLHRGRFLRRAMKRERITEAEILAALRGQDVAAVEDVEAVVLETDSSFSVVKRLDGGSDSSALANVSAGAHEALVRTRGLNLRPVTRRAKARSAPCGKSGSKGRDPKVLVPCRQTFACSLVNMQPEAATLPRGEECLYRLGHHAGARHCPSPHQIVCGCSSPVTRGHYPGEPLPADGYERRRSNIVSRQTAARER